MHGPVVLNLDSEVQGAKAQCAGIQIKPACHITPPPHPFCSLAHAMLPVLVHAGSVTMPLSPSPEAETSGGGRRREGKESPMGLPPSQVKDKNYSPGYMEQAPSRGHEASPQSGLGVGCMLCSSSKKLRGLSVSAQARRISTPFSWWEVVDDLVNLACINGTN